MTTVVAPGNRIHHNDKTESPASSDHDHGHDNRGLAIDESSVDEDAENLIGQTEPDRRQG